MVCLRRDDSESCVAAGGVVFEKEPGEPLQTDGAGVALVNAGGTPLGGMPGPGKDAGSIRAWG